MADFVFETTPRILCETGGADRLGALCAGLGMRRVMVLTDKGLVGAGLIDAPLAAIHAQGLEALLYSEVLADPPESSVDAAVRAAADFGADGMVGLGGGSSMDTAKLVALLCGTPQALPEVYGIGLARGPRLPLIQVPTTAGTGSEVTPIAIVTTPSQEKKGVVSPLLYPDLALLDARLTVGLPPTVTAMTGVDAMVHAIEAYTSRHKKNPISDALAIKALGLLSANMDRVLADGGDLSARAAMLQGSLLAGMAFANAPVAAVHALAYPLGGHFHVPHGLSNALVLPPVLAFNRPAAEAAYAALAAVVLPGRATGVPSADCDAFIGFMVDLVRRMPFAQTLREVGVARTDLDRLAEDALKVQRLLVNNPREVTLADARALYAEVF